MVHLLRKLLIALLVATIPMQGFAAARMLFCGVDPALMNAGPTARSSDHTEHARHVHEHDAHAGQPGAQADTTPAQDPANAGHEHPGHQPAPGSCSFCAVCSAAGSMVCSATSRLATGLALGELIKTLDHPFVGHIPSQPDRPPLA